MTTTAALVAVGVLTGAAVALLRQRRRRAGRRPGAGARIAFPFFGRSLSAPALDAALRLAASEGGTLVPIFLAVVPLRLAFETPLPRQSGQALDLLEAIEQRATRARVPVDARIERGRSPRHALVGALKHERFARIVVPAEAAAGEGFGPEDVAWLLAFAEEEVVVLRPRLHDVSARVSAPAAP